MAVLEPVAGSDAVRRETAHPGEYEARRSTAFARLAPCGKTPRERPALEPYWGKPTVRNLRGDDADVGIIRSPVRAIVLPDQRETSS
jgi:hypothetical protein